MANITDGLISTLQSNLSALQQHRSSTQRVQEVDRCISVTSTLVQRLISDRNQQQPNQDQQESDEDKCPICYGPFENPVKTPCGHVYCSVCIREWLKDNDTCPSCRARDLWVEALRPCGARGATSASRTAGQAVATTQATASTQAAALRAPVTENAASESGDRCALCRSTEVLLQTPCHHIFCFDCISAQLRRPERQRCPFCRSDLHFTDLQPHEHRSERFDAQAVRPMSRSPSPSVAGSLTPPPRYPSARSVTPPSSSLPTRPIGYRSISDVPGSRTRSRIRRMQEILPFADVHRCFEVLNVHGGNVDDAIDFLRDEYEEDASLGESGVVIYDSGWHRRRL